MIEAIIFDIDGTLVDSVDLHAKAWQEALQHFGHDIPFEQVRHEIGKGGDQLLPDLLPPKVVEAHGEEIMNYRSAWSSPSRSGTRPCIANVGQSGPISRRISSRD
jgi:beta-phosphoglucomutase-like phosphatase (HAD superfamily)